MGVGILPKGVRNLAETIVNGVWSWHQLPADLEEQGGYEGAHIDPFSVTPSSCRGKTDSGNHFCISWVANRLMLISLFKDEPSLVAAFTLVVEYKPFCRYRHKLTGLLTYEWDKEDSAGRLAELQQDDNVEELQLLVSMPELTEEKRDT